MPYLRNHVRVRLGDNAPHEARIPTSWAGSIQESCLRTGGVHREALASCGGQRYQNAAQSDAVGHRAADNRNVGSRTQVPGFSQERTTALIRPRFGAHLKLLTKTFHQRVQSAGQRHPPPFHGFTS